MLSMLALPDIHAANALIELMQEPLEAVDVVLLAGDMTYGRRSDLQELLEIIHRVNPNILAVCGNHDAYKMDAYLVEEGISIHGTHRIIKDVAVLGCGGALPVIGGYVFNEAEFEQILQQSIQDLKVELPKVLVCHQPPYNTLVDRSRWGLHVGSKSVRKFIEETQPLICFSGHIHEARGIDKLGETFLINAGPIIQTQEYAYAEIEDGKVKTLELRKLR